VYNRGAMCDDLPELPAETMLLFLQYATLLLIAGFVSHVLRNEEH
jgi:hypothetical protein